MSDLSRFIIAQEQYYAAALSELNSGQKTSHWIWYVFPQLKDLGRSPTAKHFGLHGMIEARDYIAHRLLGPRYLECCKALLLHRDKPVEAIIGGWVDKQKLRSSLTLMTEAGIGDVAELCLTLFYSDGRCELTERILKGSLEGG